VAQAAPGHARPARGGGPDRLDAGGPRLEEPTREKGGAAVGRNPTDQGKPGSKHHVLVDRQGVPLAAEVTAANVHDSRMLAPLLDAVAPVRTGRRGRPRRRPDKLHADKGYDYRRCRDACVARGVRHRIARKGVEAKNRLGTHRWTVERTLAWLARYRRLTIRYERLVEVHRGFLHLACALICWNYVRRL
jgi:transposase